ncbi:MAG: hypothetical protein JWQ29_2463 [Phenylobacterium sp.]|nr:hypothetical protein [Phenylobacterium sp.]
MRVPEDPPQVHQHVCPLCEAMCGVNVTYQGEQVLSVRANPENVWSRGHICPKGVTLGDLHHDPDRLRGPVVRDGDQWREVSWEAAFARIEALTAQVREKYGQRAFGLYGGNMTGKGFATSRYMMLLVGLAKFGLRVSSSSVDQLPKNVTSHLLYGNMWKIPIPDIDNTDLLVILGGNPAASKGSIFSHRDVMGAIRGLRARGGRVIVVDPVRTATAKAADQWIALRPGSDAALLLAVAHTLFAEDKVTLGHLDGLVNGLDEMRAVAAAFPPERVAAFCGVPAEAIRALALEIAAAPRAAVYGRIGTCTQEFGALASWLVDAIAILTGNLDRKGGSMWSVQVAPHLDLSPPFPTDAPLTGPPVRVRGVRAVLGQYPASCLAEEIDTPGEGQIRGLLTFGANPVLSAPGSARLEAALPQLDCMVSLDNYINETTRHAHVILPSPSTLEQPHWDVWAWVFCLTSGGHYSPALFEPADRPEEWRVMARVGAIFGGQGDADLDALDDGYFGAMCDRVGVDRAAGLAMWPEPGCERILDLCIRTGPFGDRLGENPGGLTLATFKANPNGVLLGAAEPQGAAAITTPSGKIELAPPHLLEDLPRLEAAMARAAPEMVLVSRRHLRSLNSWMHNVPSLVSGKERCTLQLHPIDAARIGVGPGDPVRVESASGALFAPAEITDDIRPGVVCLPHGWGHSTPGARLGVAERRPGVNTNVLSPGPLVDAASGNAVLNGIPVQITAATAPEAAAL